MLKSAFDPSRVFLSVLQRRAHDLAALGAGKEELTVIALNARARGDAETFEEARTTVLQYARSEGETWREICADSRDNVLGVFRPVEWDHLRWLAQFRREEEAEGWRYVESASPDLRSGADCRAAVERMERDIWLQRLN